jgi:hypothetical protein
MYAALKKNLRSIMWTRRYIAVCNSDNFKDLDISRDICALLLHNDNIIILYYIIHVLYRLNLRMMKEC